jgi:hypothetical protein
LSRHCLDNSRIRRIESAHIEKIAARKPSPESRGQIGRELINYFFAVLSLGLSSLLEFNDAAADLPIRRRHQRIDGPRSSAPGGFEQFRDPSD